jgi:localization factor PodJL
LVSAALAGAKARTASLPKTEPASYTLPGSIGSTGLRQAALANIPEAQFEIASRFADGSGVRSDMKAAAIWYEKAARRGLAPAQFRLGSLYEKGKGVPLDRARAAQLYQAAAETGNAKAMHNLAVLHAEGGAGDPDLEQAAKWFRKAAEHGVRDSQFNIGILNARGLGVTQNFAEAYKWFAIAAKSGDEQAAKRRDSIAASMNQDNLTRALAAANIFQPIPLIPDANLVVEPRGGWAAAVVEVSPSGAHLISRIQTLLTQRGFDPGPADGVIGSRTTGAIEAFQMEAGLAITGTPDLEVLSALESGAI